MAQDAFVRAFERLDTLKAPDRFGAWVCRLAFNLAIDIRRLARASLPHIEAETASLVARNGAPDDLLIASDQDRQLRVAVDALPDTARAVLHLHYWLDYRVDEIAEILGMPSGTAPGRARSAESVDARATMAADVSRERGAHDADAPGHPSERDTALRDEAEATLARHCGSPRDALPLFEKDPLLFAPGSARSYSSWGFVLLSAILETIADAPFEQVMQREIFTPANMEHTHPADPTRPKSHQAISVFRGADGSWQPLPPLDLTCKAGAGGYASTPSDAARFYVPLLKGTFVGPTFRPLLLQQDGTGSVEESGRGLGGTALVLVKPDTGLVVTLATSTGGAHDTLAAAAQQLAAVFARPPDQ